MLTGTDKFSITARNILMAGHVEELLCEFSKENVEVILLKGASFIFMSEECMAGRPMADIDLLVKARDLEKTRLLLEKNRYRLLPGESKLVYAKEGVLPIFLDLHSRLFYLEEDEVWAHAMTPEAGPAGARILSPGHNIVYLAYHMGAQHRSPEEKWLKDIDLLVRNAGAALDWRELARIADKYGLREVCYYAVLKSAESCGTPLGDEALDILKPRRTLKSAVFKKVFSGTGNDAPFSDYFLAGLVRPSYLVKAVFPGYEFMKNRYGTSGLPVPAFYFIRPFALAVKGLRGLVNFLLTTEQRRPLP